ncbi:MAG: peptidylprolyl isomerase [Bacillota bacterium]|jgi:foldase protein PrsA
MTAKEIKLVAAIMLTLLAFSAGVGAEEAQTTFLVVTLKDGSSVVYNIPVDGDKIDSAALAFSDVGLHELEGKHNLVALINNEPITTGAFYDEISNVVGYQALSYIIDETLVRQAAKSAGITVTQAEVDREFEMVREATGSDFDAVLAQYGMTQESFRKSLEMSLLVFKVSTKDVKVSAEDIAEHYNSHIADYTIPEQVRASHILVGAEKEAEEILQLLESGADFGELAKERSEDTYSAKAGGDLGYFPRGAMVPEFERVAFSTPVGETSGIVKSQYGYHILQVTGKMDARTIPMEDVWENIEWAIKSKYALDFKQLVAELKRDSAIIVFDPRFADLGTTTLP